MLTSYQENVFKVFVNILIIPFNAVAGGGGNASDSADTDSTTHF